MVNVLRSFGGYTAGGPIVVRSPGDPGRDPSTRFTAGLVAYPRIIEPTTPDAALSVAPLWQLDLTRDTALPGQLSLARSSSATYYAKSSRRTTAASGAPRLEYDPATGAAWGLLVEEQRTNLVLNSDVLTAATYINGGTMTAATSTQVGADGSSTMTLLTVAGTLTTGHSLYSNVTTVTAGTNTSVAMDVKRNNWDYIYLNIISNVQDHHVTVVFSFASGSITETHVGPNSGTLVSSSVVPLANGIYRIGFVGSVNDPSTSNRYVQFGVAPAASGNSYPVANLGSPQGSGFSGGENYYGQCVDMHIGNYQTSHITTTSASVTRSADILSTTDSGLLGATGWEIETGEVTLASSQAGTLLGVNTVTGLGIDTTSHVTTADGGTQTTANTGTWTGTNRAGLAWTP
jgi:hypothetical protein